MSRADARTNELFRQQQQALCRQTDQLFGGLLVFEWLAAIAAALWISPYTWAGTTSATHVHVWAAIFLGGAIVSLPVALALFAPGRILTRHMIGIAQMSMGALLIHLMGGRIETHFHVFGSLAFLAFYRDWRVLISATAVVAIDHLVRGFFWPQSVFGVLVAGQWRWAEHAGWVVFEDVFLILSCVRSTREMREMAERQAKLESTRDTIEEKVQQRTAELETLNKAFQEAATDARQKEEKYRHTLNSAGDAIISIDGSGNVMEYNRAAEALLGYERAELLGQPLDRIIPEPMRAAHRAGLQRFLRSGVRRLARWNALEFNILTKDGQLVPVEVSLSVLDTGETKYLTGVLRNITDRKQVEEALAERARLSALSGEVSLALVKQRASDAMLQDCAEAIVRQLDAAFARIWKLNEVEQVLELQASAGIYTHIDGPHGRVPVGKFKIGLIAQERKPHLTNNVIGDPRVGNQEWARREGMVAFAGHPLIVGHRLVGVMALFSRQPLQERTLKALASVADQIALGIDRKRAESARRRAHHENRRLLTAIPSILIGLDPSGRVRRWNKAAEDTFAIDAASALAAPFDTLAIAWEDGRPVYAVRECMASHAPVNLDDIAFRKADGTTGFLNLSLTPVAGLHGKPPSVLLLGTDTTQRRNLETQLAHAQKLESIGQLAAGIAHEINTPIQYVGDNVTFLGDAFGDIRQVLDKQGRLVTDARNGMVDEATVAELQETMARADLEYLREEVPKAIDQALEGIGRVAKIVRAMKEFSHPGSEEKVAADINKFIENTITVARNEWKYLAEVVTDFDPSLPLVPCLAGDFNQVILNLIVNAAQAIGERGGTAEHLGLIKIATRTQADYVEIRIQDNGTGIPESIRTRIFDPFFTTKPVGKGTGQGLAIAHAAIVKKHGGTLTFQTEMGKGTTFIIRLPIRCEKGGDGNGAADPLSSRSRASPAHASR